MHEKQIRNVMALDTPSRYDHFIKVVADWRCAWGLWDDGWAMYATNDDETPVFPLWPKKEYAEFCAVGEWSNFIVQEIDLDDLFENWFPAFREEKQLLAIFPLPSGRGAVIDVDEVERDLRIELSRIE